MWFCLSRLSETAANIYRVSPVTVPKEDRWKGFGATNSEELKTCFEARTKLTSDDIALGKELWERFRSGDASGLLKMAEEGSRAFPYLDETARAAAEIETRPSRILSDIRSEGTRDFDAIFVEFSQRAGVYGFGDMQVRRLLDRISA